MNKLNWKITYILLMIITFPLYLLSKLGEFCEWIRDFMFDKSYRIIEIINSKGGTITNGNNIKN